MADAKKFYAIRQGYVTGVFDTWPKAQKHIKGYKGAEFKSFPTKLLAEQWLNGTTKRRVLDNLVNKTSDVIKTPDVTKNSDVIKPTSIGIKCQFDDTDEPVKSKMPMDKRITVYVDGSCQNHPIFGAEKRVAGIGVWWGEDDPKNVSEVFEIPPITNQRAELAAILRAIKMFLNDHRSDDKYLLIESDSMYSIKCCTEYRHGWSRKGWRKSVSCGT